MYTTVVFNYDIQKYKMSVDLLCFLLADQDSLYNDGQSS